MPSVDNKISKTGFDAINETNQKNFIFDHSLNHLKTFASGSFTKTLSGGANTIEEITHSLGYRPLSIAYANNQADGKWLQMMSSAPSAFPKRQSALFNVAMYCDTSKTYFKLKNNSAGSMTIEVQYEIFFEGD